MNPKAAACALAGCVPLRFGPIPTEVRIAHHDHKLGTRGLYLYLDKEAKITGLSLAKRYTSITWDDISDTMWDNVPDDLLAELFNLIGEET